MHAPDDPQAIERDALRALVKVLPNGIAVLDMDLRFIAWNAEYLKQWDLPPDMDIMGRTMYDVFPDVSPEGRLRLDRVLAGEPIYLGDPEPYSWRRADGRVYWSRLRMVPWRYETGEMGGIIVTASASLDVNDVPHLDGRIGQKLPHAVDDEAKGGYDTGAHLSGEEMVVSHEWVLNAAIAAVAVTMDPQSVKEMAMRMAGRRGFRLRVIFEPEDNPPAGEGTKKQ